MSVKASLSLGISVLVVSTKPGNTPRQAILKKKRFLLGDGGQTSRVSVQEWAQSKSSCPLFVP